MAEGNNISSSPVETSINADKINFSGYTTFVKASDLSSSDNYIIIAGDEIVFYGTDEQRKAMFEDWTRYIGEVSNPLKTAANFNKGNYSPLDEVLNTVKPVLTKHGFGIIQVPTYENEKVCVKTIITHISGGMMSFPNLAIPVAKPDAQTVIASSTYARRGALNAILGIYGENDDDGNAASKGRKPKEAPKPIPTSKDPKLEQLANEILSIFAKKISDGVDKDKLYAIVADNNNGKKNPNSITTVESAEKILNLIKNMEAK